MLPHYLVKSMHSNAIHKKTTSTTSIIYYCFAICFKSTVYAVLKTWLYSNPEQKTAFCTIFRESDYVHETYITVYTKYYKLQKCVF